MPSGQSMDDSLSGFNLIQAVAAVGQSSISATNESNKRQAEKPQMIVGATEVCLNKRFVLQNFAWNSRIIFSLIKITLSSEYETSFSDETATGALIPRCGSKDT